MRSNRLLTQFAVRKIESFLSEGEEAGFPDTAGNTTVALKSVGDIDTLEVFLFDKIIAGLSFDGLLFLDLVLFCGDFYDSKGRPSRTTRERLNGILDLLGEELLVPAGVRVFIDPVDDLTYVGLGALRRPIGRGYPPVTIKAHHRELQFHD